MRIYPLFTLSLLGSLALMGCGGSDSDDANELEQYAVGGNIEGLNGTISLLLSKNGQGQESKELTGTGTAMSFEFTQKQDEDISFAISVQTQPASQHCEVSNGSGILTANNAKAAIVSCTDLPTQQTLTGVFLDSPVAGMSYQTASHSGVTSAEGEFQYSEGEQITFSLGGIHLPSVTAASLLTPSSVSNGSEITEINILQLLQTLDQDGDPENGIQLDSSVLDLLATTQVDISSVNFDTDINTALATLNTGLSLVPEAQAQAHFDRAKRNLLLGTWMFSEGEGKRNLLTFIDHASYIMIHEHDDGDEQTAASVEYGHYTWDLKTGAFNVTLIAQSDASGGLYDDASTVNHAQLSLNELHINFTDTGADELNTFTRIENKSDPLIGTWYVYDEEHEGISLVTFLANQEYVIAHTGNPQHYENQAVQALSGEFGTYVKSEAGYKFTATTESDGPNGFYDAQVPDAHLITALDMKAWGELQVTEATNSTETLTENGKFTLTRIGSFITELMDKPTSAAGTSLGKIHAITDINGFAPESHIGVPLQFDLPYASDKDSRCLTNFNDNHCGVRYQLDVSSNHEDTDDEYIAYGDAKLTEMSTGSIMLATYVVTTGQTVIMTFTDTQARTMTFTALLGQSVAGNTRALVSLDGQSLWQTELKAVTTAAN